MVQEERYELDPDIFNAWVYEIIDDYSNKQEVFYGGAGSGKSHGAVQKIILKAFNDKRRVLVLRKIQRTIKHSIWTLVLNKLAENGLNERNCRINKSDYEIELPNGSIFIFSGLDNAEKVKSIESVTDIIVEEATELTLDDYTQLLLRLRPPQDVKYPQIYTMFNPVSKKNWTYDYFMLNKPDNAAIYQTTYHDNRFLTDDYRAELERLKDRNPAYYRIYAIGEYATLDKLVFPVYITKIVSKEDIQGLEKYIGLDFGYTNDPSAILWGYFGNGKIYITGEYVRKGMLNDEIAEVMKDLGLHKDKSYGDSAEPKSIEELKRNGINIDGAIKGKDSVMHGIQWIQQYELIVDERCFKTIEELENYTWRKDKKTGEYINEPVDTYNHTIDALRYGLNKYIKGNNNALIFNKGAILGR